MNTKCPLVFQKGTYGEELYHRFLCAKEARIYSYRNAWSTRNADDIYQRYRFKAESKESAPETRNGFEAEWYRYRIVACLVTSSSPVPLKTRRVPQRCTLNLSRAETSSRWCGVVVRRGCASSGVVHVT
ncbi:uncharacterized protein TNCV_3733801 [Trichonephila clavipes]|nr:uncharacterized protein TNCV_3733801 [Trichonephila clavipes]